MDHHLCAQPMKSAHMKSAVRIIKYVCIAQGTKAN